ncbi:MAG TPA: MMPL family transporter [Bacteroidales bacterium]|nr:MMPL family transporter [Bacteroidales bacterium]HOL97375.1 MMPL family transporter [Bacteroidales bacterium]HRS98611.1 MMPL family transporter [Bacteroidales bacterium]HUM31710.1 MMPL family transporter [Bacteroidales bacterium]
MWHKIARIILRNRIALLSTLFVITVFMSWQATKIEMDYHFANMLSNKDTVYLDNLRFKKIFGEEANGIIISFDAEHLFILENFQKFQKLCDNLRKIKYVTGVFTVTEAVNIHQTTIETADGFNKRVFQTYKLFSEEVKTQEQLDSIKSVFFSLPFYRELLYDKDTSIFLMSVTIDKKIIDSKLRIPVVFEVEKQILSYSDDCKIPVHISGLPYIRTKNMNMIKKEIVIFIILAAFICIFFLYLFFRSFKVIGVTLILVGFSVLWAVGLMGILGYKITILTGMIPPLLIIIGVPNTVFLLTKYHRETISHGNKILALQRVISKIGNAVFLSNVTTAAGFATFITTKSDILVEFGIISSLGILFVFINAIIIVPAIFSFLKPPSEKYTKHLKYKLINTIVDIVTNIVTKHRIKVYITVFVILILALIGISQIKQTGYLLDDIPESNPIYVDLKYLEKAFNGISPLEIAIESKDSLKGLQLIEQIRSIDSLQQKLRTYPELSRSMSIADAVKFLYQAYSKGNTNNYRLPDDPKTWETIFNRLPNGLNQNLAKSFVDSTNTITRISLNIADIGTKRMSVLLPKIKEDLYHYFPPDKYNIILTGSTVMYFTGTTYLIKNLFISLSLAIIFISILMYFIQRSIKMVGIALIPNIIPMLVTAGLMGYFGIPIKPSTILVFSIALGISVDGSIHLLTKYRQELAVNGWNMGNAVRKALKETGTSMMYTIFILFFGFLIFAASGFGGTKALGILISTTLFVSMLCNLILLPSLLLSLESFLSRKNFPEPYIEIEDDEDSENPENEKREK